MAAILDNERLCMTDWREHITLDISDKTMRGHVEQALDQIASFPEWQQIAQGLEVMRKETGIEQATISQGFSNLSKLGREITLSDREISAVNVRSTDGHYMDFSYQRVVLHELLHQSGAAVEVMNAFMDENRERLQKEIVDQWQEDYPEFRDELAQHGTINGQTIADALNTVAETVMIPMAHGNTVDAPQWQLDLAHQAMESTAEFNEAINEMPIISVANDVMRRYYQEPDRLNHTGAKIDRANPLTGAQPTLDKDHSYDTLNFRYLLSAEASDNAEYVAADRASLAALVEQTGLNETQEAALDRDGNGFSVDDLDRDRDGDFDSQDLAALAAEANIDAAALGISLSGITSMEEVGDLVQTTANALAQSNDPSIER